MLLIKGDEKYPLVLDIPHAGRMYDYSEFFTDLSEKKLQELEDRYIDFIVGDLFNLSQYTLVATCPRSIIDLNRPIWKNGQMSALRKETRQGHKVWRKHPSKACYTKLVKKYYTTYYEALYVSISETLKNNGDALHLNVHSFPTLGKCRHTAEVREHPFDIYLGNRNSLKGLYEMTVLAKEFNSLGYRTSINSTFSGGNIVKDVQSRYKNITSIQIEIKRGLYLDNDLVISKNYEIHKQNITMAIGNALLIIYSTKS